MSRPGPAGLEPNHGAARHGSHAVGFTCLPGKKGALVIFNPHELQVEDVSRDLALFQFLVAWAFERRFFHGPGAFGPAGWTSWWG